MLPESNSSPPHLINVSSTENSGRKKGQKNNYLTTTAIVVPPPPLNPDDLDVTQPEYSTPFESPLSNPLHLFPLLHATISAYPEMISDSAY